MKYAGWHSQDDGYIIVYDSEMNIGMRSCIASRITFANGVQREEVEAETTGEIDWILDFKFNHSYEIKSGWKRWDSNQATIPAEGAVGYSFPMMVECGDYCDRTVGSSAVTLVASILAIVALSTM